MVVRDYEIVNTTFIVTGNMYDRDNHHLRHLNHYHSDLDGNDRFVHNMAGVRRTLF